MASRLADVPGKRHRRLGFPVYLVGPFQIELGEQLRYLRRDRLVAFEIEDDEAVGETLREKGVADGVVVAEIRSEASNPATGKSRTLSGGLL